MMKNRFMLFMCHGYGPGGGMEDYIGRFDTVDELEYNIRMKYQSDVLLNYVSVYDIETDTTILHGETGFRIDNNDYYRPTINEDNLKLLLYAINEYCIKNN